jgi:hypothetical protein
MKNRRESPPPSRWGRSKGGIPFYLVHTTKRDAQGRKLYRLKYAQGILGRHWTFQELEEAGVRWLQRRPKGWAV